jgi:hypothetical protein
MPEFYIVNDAPKIEAASAKEAARLYAIQEKYDAATILVARGVLTFEGRRVPPGFDVSEIGG